MKNVRKQSQQQQDVRKYFDKALDEAGCDGHKDREDWKLVEFADK